MEHKSFCQGDLIFAFSLFIRVDVMHGDFLPFALQNLLCSMEERKSSLSYLRNVASAECLPFCIQHEYLNPV